MAQFVSSQVATDGGTATSLAITKPVSLAVGDFLLAQIAVNTFSSTIGAPVGWTALRLDATTRIFYKFADAADVAAASYTFTSSLATTISGRVSRFIQVSSTNPIDQNNGGVNTASSTVTSSGITPTAPSSLFVMTVSSIQGGTGTAVNTYSIATNNPTWTEAYDSDLGPSILSMAYAIRPQMTATGNATAVFNNSVSELSLQIFNINGAIEAPFFGLAAPAFFQATVRAVLQPFGVIPGFFAVTARGVANKWNNLAKNISDWTNEPKS